MIIIFIGTIITIIGAIITGVGTFKHNKASSTRMQDIQSTASNIDTKADKQLNEISNLTNKNFELNTLVDSLNNKVQDQASIIGALSQQNSDLSLQLAKSTESLFGNITGGDSYCEAIIKPINTAQAELTFIQHGKFPLYDVTLRIVDLEIFSSTGVSTYADLSKSQLIVNVGNLQPNSAFVSGFFNSDFSKEFRSFNLFYSARNGFFTQSIRMFKKDGKWHGATRITGGINNEQVYYEKIDPLFPKEMLKWN